LFWVWRNQFRNYFCTTTARRYELITAARSIAEAKIGLSTGGVLESCVLTARELRLSRIYADGWDTGRRFSADRELHATQIAALNPHKREPECTRWLLGFRGARAAGRKNV
jgi:hypothetical protein